VIEWKGDRRRRFPVDQAPIEIPVEEVPGISLGGFSDCYLTLADSEGVGQTAQESNGGRENSLGIWTQIQIHPFAQGRVSKGVAMVFIRDVCSVDLLNCEPSECDEDGSSRKAGL
jgi:hypothetical protein